MMAGVSSRRHRRRASGPSVSTSSASSHRSSRAESRIDRGTRPAITAPAYCCRMASNGKARIGCAAWSGVSWHGCSGATAPIAAGGKDVDGRRSEVLASMVCDLRQHVSGHRVPGGCGKFKEGRTSGVPCQSLVEHSVVRRPQTRSGRLGSVFALYVDERIERGDRPTFSLAAVKAAPRKSAVLCDAIAMGPEVGGMTAAAESVASAS